jgi:hypothetical protein
MTAAAQGNALLWLRGCLSLAVCLFSVASALLIGWGGAAVHLMLRL